MPLLFGNTHYLHLPEKEVVETREFPNAKEPCQLVKAYKIEFSGKEIAALALTTKSFYRSIASSTMLQTQKILPLALISPNLTQLQKAHLGSVILRKEISAARISVGKAIRNTHPDKIKNLKSSTYYGYAEEHHLTKAMKLGYQPCQIRAKWFSSDDYEVLNELEVLRDAATKAKQDLDNLIKNHQELQAIANKSKKERDEKLSLVNEKFKLLEDVLARASVTPAINTSKTTFLDVKALEKLGFTREEIFEIQKKEEENMQENEQNKNKSVSDVFGDTLIPKVKAIQAKYFDAFIEEKEAFQKMDAEDSKKRLERETKEKIEYEKYEKSEQAFKEFESLFAYDKIKGLSSIKLQGLRAGLLPSQLPEIRDHHIQTLLD